MITQPKYSSLCGQCCLGTILNISLEDSIALVGHKRGTYPKELAVHFECESLKLTKGMPVKYSLCKVHYEHKKDTHWILYKDSKIYDPNIGEWVNIEVWQMAFSHVLPRITSYIEINNGQT